MNIRTLAMSLAALITLASAPAQAGCTRAMPSGADSAIPTDGRIDQGLAEAAILSEVNYHRCRKGLAEVAPAGGIRKVAMRHARWMAEKHTLSHRSTVMGQSTTLARLKHSGVRFRAGSENIGQISRYQIDGRSFQIASSSACAFRTSGGAAIPPHSYASMARVVVGLWMDSSGHKRNILDRKVRYTGAGIAYDSRGPHCGNIYISQSFAG